MKYILILGATSDMAIATAHKYAAQGWGILLAGRDSIALASIKTDLTLRYTIQVELVEFNATSYASHRGFMQALPHKPDVTALFFGYLGKHNEALSNWDESKAILEINFIGAASILQEAANYYEQAKQGTIVGVSSVAGERGRQSNYIYGSAKAGLTAFLSGLRNRLFKSNVHVVTVKPGFVNTRMTEHLDLPKPLTASPEQVANAIYKAVAKRQDTIYVLPAWSLIMKNIKLIPEKLFKRMSL